MNKWPLCKFNKQHFVCTFGWKWFIAYTIHTKCDKAIQPFIYLERDKAEQSKIKCTNVYIARTQSSPASKFICINGFVLFCFCLCPVQFWHVLTLADLCNPNAKIIWLIVSATEWILSANILCEPVTSHTINFSRKIVQLLQNNIFQYQYQCEKRRKIMYNKNKSANKMIIISPMKPCGVCKSHNTCVHNLI